MSRKNVIRKTGQFISDIRKEKNLTQKQLAEEIGVSDKAISRWETGRGMPDTSIMPDLCKVLDISINELLSGQRLSSEDYHGKAEDNMVKLIKTNKAVKRQGRKAIVGTIVGILLLNFSEASNCFFLLKGTPMRSLCSYQKNPSMP